MARRVEALREKPKGSVRESLDKLYDEHRAAMDELAK
ncbi:MAG: hypothetical protein QOE90_2193 [Thermoplasmata archaeon]|jgi:hypothetical protein|nr:hypothetical protein [Thermoplasmata archaeon]